MTRWPELVQCLLEDHYDTKYAHNMEKNPLATIALEDDSEDQLAAFFKAASDISSLEAVSGRGISQHIPESVGFI